MYRFVTRFLWLLYLYSLTGCSLILEPRYYRARPGADASQESGSSDGLWMDGWLVDRADPRVDAFGQGDVVTGFDVSEDETDGGAQIEASLEDGSADVTESTEAGFDVDAADAAVDAAPLDVRTSDVTDASVLSDVSDVADIGVLRDVQDAGDARDAEPDALADVVRDAPDAFDAGPEYPVTLQFRQDGVGLVADYFIRWQLPGGMMTMWERGHCAGGISAVFMGGFTWSSCTTDRSFPAMTGFEFYPIYGDMRPVCGMGECAPFNLSDRANAVWNGHRFAGSMAPYPVFLYSEVFAPGMIRSFLHVDLH